MQVTENLNFIEAVSGGFCWCRRVLPPDTFQTPLEAILGAEDSRI